MDCTEVQMVEGVAFTDHLLQVTAVAMLLYTAAKVGGRRLWKSLTWRVETTVGGLEFCFRCRRIGVDGESR